MKKQLNKYKHKLFAIIVALLLIGLDYFTKIIAENYLPLHERITAIPKVFDFCFLYNNGAAFGILDNARWVFMLATVIFLIAGIIVFIKLKPENILVSYTIMLIIAGGIGNMIDRLTTGLVVDFLTFNFIDFPSFNIADCCVVIGCIILVIYLFADSFKSNKEISNESN